MFSTSAMACSHHHPWLVLRNSLAFISLFTFATSLLCFFFFSFNATTNTSQDSSSFNSPFTIRRNVAGIFPDKNYNHTSSYSDSSYSYHQEKIRIGDDYGSCDLFDGRWIADEEMGPSYLPGTCPFIDESFNCFKNGRKDLDYTALRWKPNNCNIPRLDGKKMLEMLRGKRVAFIGDSLNRNMWESLVCTLLQSVGDKSRVFEISGKRQFKTESFYAFSFQDYNCTIEFFRSPFLVQERAGLDSEGNPKQTLRLDLIDKLSEKYKAADVLIFNSGHWYTHPRTKQGKDFYQEGEHVHKLMNANVAYWKALRTWARWIESNVDPSRSLVFFRSYSASHFNGGQWNTGGSCDGETHPITDDNHLVKYPLATIADSVMREIRFPLQYMNVTRMTDYRKDGHPSVYSRPPERRKPGGGQDCSHWCLPGVPDAWNEILYAILYKKWSAETNTFTET